ncbi:MAG: hypothetical protein LH632_05060 [Rhodoferax sp.]|nr:hypothetical protein [Rhodoferax sp.]
MDDVENIIIGDLRAIRADVGTVKEDVRELKNRMANLEGGQAMIMQNLGHQASVNAQQHLSYDRIIERIEKLEKRLEITG